MNLVFSWLSAILTIILIALFPARKLVEKMNLKPGGALANAYKLMGRRHIAIGFFVIPVVYCHCRIAAHATCERSIFGAVLLLLLILLALTWLLRKPLGRHWKRLHQILSAILALFMAYHCLIEF